ncbi:MAG TPA: sigma-70 family RNA polymerase sigma factor [Chryseosolibacter sp.]|nr:sigma-70 family RNA polymerase sigma factor [Chryseosolibacter sp.]
MTITSHYSSLKPYLFSVAYNMTGQVQEAEDIVQDAFEDVLRKERADVQNVKSYMTRVVVNKAIDRLSHLKKQREIYPGPWLPEPYITPSDSAHHDILPYAFIHLMEELNSVERAVFILRESFDYPYEEVAEICGLTVDNSRQVLHRAKQKLKRPLSASATTNRQANGKILQEFLKACLSRDATKLSELLKEDVLLYSDGGGKVVAARKILEGIASVAKFLFGISSKTFDKWSAARSVSVNNGRALVVPDENGIYMVLIPHIEDGKLLKIFLMRNPDKIFYENPVTK